MAPGPARCPPSAAVPETKEQKPTLTPPSAHHLMHKQLSFTCHPCKQGPDQRRSGRVGGWRVGGLRRRRGPLMRRDKSVTLISLIALASLEGKRR